MTAPCQGPDPDTRPPVFRAPPDACDCHFHIFGPVARYPYRSDRSFTPPEATLEAYRRMAMTLGIARCVIVQPSVYGTDNACTWAAMERLGPQCHGIAVVDEDIRTIDLERMHAAGFRGVRFNLLFRGGAKLGSLEQVARKIAALGWHIQLLIDGRALSELASRLRALPVPIVIDHMGHAPAALGSDHPGFQALLALLKEGRCWVKLSGAYRTSAERVPYRDVVQIAGALIESGPDRVVWGTDWPHPAFEGAMPNDADLLDLVPSWTNDAVLQRKILVDNPAALYGF